MIFFLTTEQVIEIHDFQLEEHGGLDGYRDRGSIDSMVSRVENLHAYEGETNLFVLAATYMIAISRGHGFNDANKRTALLSALTFLDMNDIFVVTPVDFADYVAEIAQGMHDNQSIAEELRKLAAI